MSNTPPTTELLKVILPKLGRMRMPIPLETNGTDSPYNEVWVGDDYVVRIARRKGNDGLLYEARLAPGLPEEVGYPRVLGSGVVEDRAWLATRRVDGTPLKLAWPRLDSGQKAAALRSIKAKLDAIHSSSSDVPWEKQAPFRPVPFGSDLFEGLSPALFTAKLERLERADYIEPDLRERLMARYGDLRNAAGVPQALGDQPFSMASWPGAVRVHNDSHLANFLWNGTDVTTTLDFELASYGPPDVDAFHVARSIGYYDPSFVPDKIVQPALRALLGSSARAFKRYALYGLVRDVQLIDAYLHPTVDQAVERVPTDEHRKRTKEAFEAIANGTGFFDRLALAVSPTSIAPSLARSELQAS